MRSPELHLLYYWQMTRALVADNKRLTEDNLYVRAKLAELYRDDKYYNLLKLYQKQLVKSVDQQDEINYLNRELGKTKMRKWWKWYN